MAFLGRFALSRVPWQIYAALAVVVLLGVAGWQIDLRAYNRGYAEADAKWLARTQAEVERQVKANDAAWARAQQEIERLNEVRRVRDATIERLNQEALGDSDADRDAFGVDSVRRLNQRD